MSLTVTELYGPGSSRRLDLLDVAVLEAILLQALGPDSDAMVVTRVGATLMVELSPFGRAVALEVAARNADEEVDGWLGLLAPALVGEALAVVGLDWEAEAELAVELAAARRADEVAAVVAACRVGPVYADLECTLGQLLAPGVLCADLALLTWPC